MGGQDRFFFRAIRVKIKTKELISRYKKKQSNVVYGGLIDRLFLFHDGKNQSETAFVVLGEHEPKSNHENEILYFYFAF